MKQLETHFLSMEFFEVDKKVHVWPEVNTSGQHLKMFVCN